MSSDPNIGLMLNQERSDDDEFPGLDGEDVSLQEVMQKWKKDEKIKTSMSLRNMRKRPSRRSTY